MDRIEALEKRIETLENMLKSASSLQMKPVEALQKKDVIEEIKRLKKNGATLKEIADLFNDNGLATFSGTGHWHAQSVHKLLNLKEHQKKERKRYALKKEKSK